MKQVIPRPALSRVALRVPVLSAGDDAVAVLEADMLRRNVTLSHLHEVGVRLLMHLSSVLPACKPHESVTLSCLLWPQFWIAR